MSRPRAGFTLIESVIVIVLIAILSVMVSPVFLTAPLQLRAVADGMVEHLRFAQRQAMYGHQSTIVRIHRAPPSYVITWQDGRSMTDPSTGNELRVFFPYGVEVLSTLPGVLRFDPQLGTPYLEDGPLDHQALINLTMSNETVTIVIEPNTGFVFIQRD